MGQLLMCISTSYQIRVNVKEKIIDGSLREPRMVDGEINNGDGALAKELSEQGKAHGRKMEEFNRQASEFIFRENNANGRVEPDTIDLHGQFVEEAEEILEQRIKIVGKGNHSANHVQKIKPRVEQVCRELGLQYATEENAGRIHVNLTGGPADMAQSGYTPSHQQYPGQQPHHQPHHQQQQQQQQQQQDPVEQMVNAILPRVLRKLEKACCVVM
ncbi:Smr domain-containing protein [Aspergillus tanneri]|uniref:Smr domain-containing protein n=1 Tax=Aspergillus tanneri TaxID=1220188 RepID=A0A5M9MXH0_9EURO|nr:uncharacterized protein ATNIH1004_000697 [Aspergillus tanneri]KAA8651801.1 hypothetical protein ATNIH1004_000697 [Aspergillus tanneri]